jgi:hypothetical protein
MRRYAAQGFWNPITVFEAYLRGALQAEINFGFSSRDGSPVDAYHFRAELHHSSPMGQFNAVDCEIFDIVKYGAIFDVPSKGQLELSVLVFTGKIGQDGKRIGVGIVGPLSVRLVELDVCPGLIINSREPSVQIPIESSQRNVNRELDLGLLRISERMDRPSTSIYDLPSNVVECCTVVREGITSKQGPSDRKGGYRCDAPYKTPFGRVELEFSAERTNTRLAFHPSANFIHHCLGVCLRPIEFSPRVRYLAHGV